MAFTQMALLILFVGASRCAGTKTCIPSPNSGCIEALTCVSTHLTQLVSQVANAFSVFAIARVCWIWRTVFAWRMYMVRCHCSLGSRNACQSIHFNFVHPSSFPPVPPQQP